MIGNLQSFLDDQSAQKGSDDVNAHLLNSAAAILLRYWLVFVIIGSIQHFHLGNGVSLTVYFDEGEDFYSPVGSEVHSSQQAVLEGNFTRQLIMKT